MKRNFNHNFFQRIFKKTSNRCNKNSNYKIKPHQFKPSPIRFSNKIKLIILLKINIKIIHFKKRIKTNSLITQVLSVSPSSSLLSTILQMISQFLLKLIQQILTIITINTIKKPKQSKRCIFDF